MKTMQTWSSVQKRAIDLKNEAVAEIPNLEPFYHGRIPNLDHYKRLTIKDKDLVKQIATYGYLRCFEELNVKLYFTQALIVGANLLATHYKIFTVLPSQYGKSFLSACTALLQASEGETTSVVANDQDLTQKIMTEVWRVLPGASEKFKKKSTTPIDKFEKAQTSLSKNRVGFVGGGSVEGLTLGGKYGNSLTGNKAVGQSGNYIIDECALVPDGNYAQTGRSEVRYRADGRPYTSMEMSNPHTINHFYRDMIADPVPKGTLVVWADIRISIEEGAQEFSDTDPKKPEFTDTKFFKNEETCLSYYLCDFGNVSDGSFFPVSPVVDNTPLSPYSKYVLGLDAANRGADAIMGAFLEYPNEERNSVRLTKLMNFKPSSWKDYETPKQIEDSIVEVCKKFPIQCICMDLGGGEWLYQRLLDRFLLEGLDIPIKGIMFNSRPTVERVRQGFDPEYGDGNGAEMGVNKRAEMYLDLRDLMQEQQITFVQEVVQVIQDEMHALGRELFVNSGKIQLEDKTRIVKKRLGRSPDSLDALVLATHGYILYNLGLLDDILSQYYA